MECIGAQEANILVNENISSKSFPYDVPLNADLVIDTQSLSLEDSVKQVLDVLRKRGAI